MPKYILLSHILWQNKMRYLKLIILTDAKEISIQLLALFKLRFRRGYVNAKKKK